MVQRVSVGLVVLTEVPQLGLVAVLQRRGEWNTEKMAPESYPGACQVTVHGKAKEGESDGDALAREIHEELCSEFAQCLLELAEKGCAMQLLVREEGERETVITRGIKVPCEVLRSIQWGPDSGGLRLLSREELSSVVDLRTFDKKTGVTDRTVIAMFPDEKAAIEKAFATFAILPA